MIQFLNAIAKQIFEFLNIQKQPLEVLHEKRYSEKFGKIKRKTPVLVYLFSKIADLGHAILVKRDSSTAFSCEFCKIIKSNFFAEHLRTTASECLNVVSYFK